MVDQFRIGAEPQQPEGSAQPASAPAPAPAAPPGPADSGASQGSLPLPAGSADAAVDAEGSRPSAPSGLQGGDGSDSHGLGGGDGDGSDSYGLGPDDAFGSDVEWESLSYTGDESDPYYDTGSSEDGEWAEGDESMSDDSEASSLEPDDEQEAFDDLHRSTDGRIFHAQPSSCRLRTVCTHFQSADALAVCDSGPGGSLLVAATDNTGVSLYRLPGAGSLDRLGREKGFPHRLGGFQSIVHVYSMALAPDGGALATGGEMGVLALYALDVEAPPRPKVRLTQVPGFQPDFVRPGLFYTPLIPPSLPPPPGQAGPSAGDEGAVPPGPGRRTGWSFPGQGMQLPSEEQKWFLRWVRANPRALLPESAPAPAPAPDYWGDYTQVGAEAALVGIHVTDSWDAVGGSAAAAAPEPPSQPAAAAGEARHGAVTLTCLLALGMVSDEGARTRPVEEEAMVNGVRFGLVQGKARLLAAEQSGYVYVLESPPRGGAPNALPDALMCTGLGEPSAWWTMLPVNLYLADPTPHGASCRQAVVRRTAALGPFGCPLNLALPSPDGRWVAVVGDCNHLFLVDQGAGFARETLPFACSPDWTEMADPNLDAGAQYCAWNTSSSLVAVTSDALRAVFVFDAATRTRVLRVEGFQRACLPVAFAPWDDSVVVFGELARAVHTRDARGGDQYAYEGLADLAEGRPHTQLLRVPLNTTRMHGRPRRRINGLAVTRHGDLLVGTEQGWMFRYLAALPWSAETHQLWPPAFREAAGTLLKVAGRRPARDNRPASADGEAPTTLAALPAPVLQHIIALAAAPGRVEWMHPPEGAPPVMEEEALAAGEQLD